MTENTDGFQPVLLLLAEAMREAEPIQNQLAEVQSRIASYRDTLQAMMQHASVKTVQGHGLTAYRANRSQTVITNRNDLESALRESDLWEQCVRLDLTAAKNIGIQIEAPGVEKQSVEVFAVRSDKS